jgi:hypothetical protein
VRRSSRPTCSSTAGRTLSPRKLQSLLQACCEGEAAVLVVRGAASAAPPCAEELSLATSQKYGAGNSVMMDILV